ncbi:unnamed protein product [Psylliodes chrysocephalus]|uniref:Uncharacterized protein n=1 Tax=Psylliodes chrysocephalus TaxID=3402493 RepID=A0A9P0D7L4_9CUCU|nr:unnamed protein product [Psylliodes chrysocephala]
MLAPLLQLVFIYYQHDASRLFIFFFLRLFFISFQAAMREARRRTTGKFEYGIGFYRCNKMNYSDLHMWILMQQCESNPVI